MKVLLDECIPRKFKRAAELTCEFFPQRVVKPLTCACTDPINQRFLRFLDGTPQLTYREKRCLVSCIQHEGKSTSG